MKPQNDPLASRLARDLPIKTRPEAWLTAHRDAVMQLLRTESMAELTELTRLNSGTILRWRRKAEARPVPPTQEVSLESDVCYWRGRAEAFHEALTLLSGKV